MTSSNTLIQEEFLRSQHSQLRKNIYIYVRRSSWIELGWIIIFYSL